MQLDGLQSFVDTEIAKKQEKERLKSDRQRRKETKRSVEEELAEDTKIEETVEEFLHFYFRRERQVLEKIYGSEWLSYVKHPEFPREEFTAEDSRRDSSSSSTISASRRHSIVTRMQEKSKGIASLMLPKSGGL